ncbi:hypothetical protein [Gordonia sp. (in: high G+C Gram-positive bacteria)]
MGAPTQTANLTPDTTATYNISGSCLWTMLTLVPLALLLLVLAL